MTHLHARIEALKTSDLGVVRAISFPGEHCHVELMDILSALEAEVTQGASDLASEFGRHIDLLPRA